MWMYNQYWSPRLYLGKNIKLMELYTPLVLLPRPRGQVLQQGVEAGEGYTVGHPE